MIDDEKFQKAITEADRPVLVDFFADWCEPCKTLSFILDRVAEDFKKEIILLKVNIDDIPLTAQKFGINRIPFIVLFKQGKPLAGLLGLRPEEEIKRWILEKTEEGVDELIIKYEKHAQENNFKLNPDRKKVEGIIKGLINNKKRHGEKYCPCRRVTGEKREDQKNICPCYYHKEEIEKEGHCFCDLFIR